MPTPDLMAYLETVRGRIAKATSRARWIPNAKLENGEWNTSTSNRKQKWAGEPCPEVDNEEQAQRDCELAAHAPDDLDRLERLVRVAHEVAHTTEQYHVCDAIPPDVGCHVCDALTYWSTTVQAVLKDG